MPITSSSGLSLPEFTRQLRAISSVTQGDLLGAMLEQTVRIEDRTASGVDYQGNPFAPYAADADRTFRQSLPKFSLPGQIRTRVPISHVNTRSTVHRSLRSTSKQAASTVKAYPISRRNPIPGLRSSATFSLSGRRIKTGTVTLKSSGAMLNSIVAVVGGTVLPYTANPPALDSYLTPATHAEYGIVDAEQAKIAQYHNTGTDKLPKREFLNTSSSDLSLMEDYLYSRIVARQANLKT